MKTLPESGQMRCDLQNGRMPTIVISVKKVFVRIISISPRTKFHRDAGILNYLYDKFNVSALINKLSIWHRLCGLLTLDVAPLRGECGRGAASPY